MLTLLLCVARFWYDVVVVSVIDAALFRGFRSWVVVA